MKKAGNNQFADKLEQEYSGRMLGVLIAAAVSVLILVCSLPFINWIVVDAATITEVQKLGDTVTIQSGYSIYNFLGFVGDSKLGSLGIVAMIILIWMIATVYFHLSLVIKVIGNKKGKKGNLSLYVTAQTAMLFSVILSIVLVGYIAFSNGKIGSNALTLNPMVYVIFLIALVAYVMIKIMEKREMERYKEHGFFAEVKKNKVLFIMLIPTFVYFMINNYLPMIGSYFAFTNFNFRDGLWASPFYGLKNFEYLWKADLPRLMRNTVLYNIVFIFLGNALQIIFAIFVSQVTVKWFKKASQTLMFMPYFVSFVILNVLVYNLFEYDYGLVNNVVTSLGGSKIDFYNQPKYWPFLITIFYIWKNIGYGMVVYLATIMGIDTELYEAAKVDGANIFQQIRHITLPLLKPTFIILLLYALGSIMKGQFELFYQMVGRNGLLYNATDIFDTYVYRITTSQPLSIGPGTAAGLFQSVFGFVLIVVVNWLVKRKNSEYALF